MEDIAIWLLQCGILRVLYLVLVSRFHLHCPELLYFPCWIKPDDRVVNQVFGMTSGMGLLPLTFDCECDRTGLRSLQLILISYRESNRLCRISTAGAKLGDRQRGCITGFLDLDSCHCAILLQRLV